MARPMPVVFFGHGSPTNVREENAATRAWAAIAGSIPRPRAILSISAHWVTQGSAVTAAERPETIHDFGRGLGDDLFAYRYPAMGSPELVDRVCDLLGAEVVRDPNRGLDHGSWAVLLKAWPAADVPVVQLSLDGDSPALRHVELGRKLQPLREEGFLIAASGNIVHNLGAMDWHEREPPYPWAVEFNETVKTLIAHHDAETLAAPFDLGPAARMAMPTAEHYVPLLYAMGAANSRDRPRFEADTICYRSLSMTSVVWDS